MLIHCVAVVHSFFECKKKADGKRKEPFAVEQQVRRLPAVLEIASSIPAGGINFRWSKATTGRQWQTTFA